MEKVLTIPPIGKNKNVKTKTHHPPSCRVANTIQNHNHPISSDTPKENVPDEQKVNKKLSTLLDLCVSSLRRGHANLLCIVPILTDDPRRESNMRVIIWNIGLASLVFCGLAPPFVFIPRFFVFGVWRLCNISSAYIDIAPNLSKTEITFGT